MFTGLLKKLVILYMLRAVPASAKGSCLTGGFFFAQGRNMVDDHALRGHVFAHVTASEPVRCFRACQSDCRCISFNYQQSGSKDNCQLNEENRYTNFSALEFLEGWQYYDLVIDYNVKANAPFVECRNGCCESGPCLNGGTCHETCDVIGKRFTCKCGALATGTLCETALCSTPDWLPFQNSCFKKITEELNWFEAQKSCASINSNLASIQSKEENNFVHQKVSSGSSSLWIGFYNVNNADHSYEWVDGSTVSFTKWNHNEPNNHGLQGINENCTEFNADGKWNDLNCFFKLNFVCSKKFNP